MDKPNYFDEFYLDKEKDVVVELYKGQNDCEIEYMIRTPNHTSGNLISNLARISGQEFSRDENGLKVIKGKIPASINSENEVFYKFILGDITIADIYESGIEVKAMMPAITKTLMSQTNDYEFDLNHTIVRSILYKKSRFRTDLHTHMNANLSPDVLIALGIANQLRYPLYYIKKLNLKITSTQEKRIMKDRSIVEKQFVDSPLVGKYKVRRIDDNTFINFADLILNNLDNAYENIRKIRNSLSLLKDGQAVFTNLEKLYLYRYVFCKGVKTESPITLTKNKIDQIPEKDIKNYVKLMLEDKKNDAYKNNTIRQDKYLWMAREYQKQGISYVEIADTDLVKLGEPAVKVLEEVHSVMPHIEKETGVKIRLLAAIRRIPLTIIKDQKTSTNYLRENLDVLRAIAKSPYVIGSDFIGEEINDISELKPVIKELVQYAVTEDKGFTIRIHAGENEGLKDNVKKAIECIKDSLEPGQKMPRYRLGHGVYTPDLNSEAGRELMQEMVETGGIIEFQLTSNVRLNNLTDLRRHPIKTYLDYGVNCIQGTDGCGFYGTDTWDEQLALHNLLGLTDDDFAKMKKVEDEIISDREEYFKNKSKAFEKFLAGRSIREAVLELENENLAKSEEHPVQMRISQQVDSEENLKDKIVDFPINKFPIIIAGGSFNSDGRETTVDDQGKQIIEELVKKLDSDKVYFVLGHTLSGYEEAIIEYSHKYGKNFEINAIVPKEVSESELERLKSNKINGVRISIERQKLGLYKSFNYEIFERRSSAVFAFDGNSPVSNLIQEAKNGKGSSSIYVNDRVEALRDKASSLKGYVKTFNVEHGAVEELLNNYPEFRSSNSKS